jgi:hypothetical protein
MARQGTEQADGFGLRGLRPHAAAHGKLAAPFRSTPSDNVITAYECLHFMKKKRPRDTRSCALKLDMKKAYDSVEWAYLCAVMTQLGFHRLWVDMVMRLITAVSFSVLFNGELT